LSQGAHLLYSLKQLRSVLSDERVAELAAQTTNIAAQRRIDFF